MNSQAKHYAQAMLTLGESEVHNVITYLRNKGLLKLLPAILKETEKLVEKKARSERITLVSAKALDSEKLASIKNEHLEIFSKGKEITQVIDESLIGGYVLQSGHRIVDASYKRVLVDLYQKIRT